MLSTYNEPMVLEKRSVKEIFQARLIAALRDLGIADHGRGVWLAEKMDVTPKAAGKWIDGDSMPRKERWHDLAKVLKKPELYFFAPEDYDPEDPGSKDSISSISGSGVSLTPEEIALIMDNAMRLPPDKLSELVSKLVNQITNPSQSTKE